MYQSSPEPIDLPGELPELDDDPETVDEPPRDGTEPLLIPLGDELDTDRDDETAADLDIGIDLSLGLDGAGEANEDLVLDIGELLDDAMERSLEEDDGNEPADPNDFDADVGIQSLPEHVPDTDDEEPAPASDEIAGELPALDADDAGEPGAEPNWVEIDSLAASDHPLHDAARHWHARIVTGIDRPCRDLALAHGDVLVGGGGLWRARGETAELLFNDDKPIESLAVTMGSVVYVNSAGLMRRLVLDTGGNSATGSGTLDDATTLLVATVQDGERLVAVSSAKSAFESADGGRSWNRIPIQGRVLALPRRADRLVMLLERNGDRVLAVQDARQSFVDRQLEHLAFLVASGDAPSIDALDQVIVLLDPGRGLLISSDAGQTFSSVPGCTGASAVCLGRFENRIRAWVALHSEWTGKTDIAMIDPVEASAERIAELSLTEPSEEAEEFPTSALCWDAESCRLWVAGAHGLILLEPDDVDEGAPASSV
jgi:hypothetical protein